MPHSPGVPGLSQFEVRCASPIRCSSLPPTEVHLIWSLRFTFQDVVYDLDGQSHSMLPHVVGEAFRPQISSVSEFCATILAATKAACRKAHLNPRHSPGLEEAGDDLTLLLVPGAVHKVRWIRPFRFLRTPPVADER